MMRKTWFGKLARTDPAEARRRLCKAIEDAGCFARAPALLGVSRRHLQRLTYMLDAWDLVEARRARAGIMRRTG